MRRDDLQVFARTIRDTSNVTFIIGAGASVRAGIPLGKTLVDEAKAKYPHRIKSDTDDYGLVMRELSPAERDELIQPHLDKAELSWGHLALACLLKAGHINRVLTFNFDMVIEKALARLDMQMPTYDFGVAPVSDRIEDLAKPSIIHLHGQSFGFSILNSDTETDSHAKNLESLICHELRNAITVVIGYSGQSDKAFRVIEQGYTNRQRLFWLGHGESPDPHLNTLLEHEYAEFHGGCDYDILMMDLARELGCFPPTLLQNPMQHVLEGLQDMAEFPTTAKDTVDLKKVLSTRLKKEADRWDAEESNDEKAVLGLMGEEDAGVTQALNTLISSIAKDAKYWALQREANKLVPDNPDPNLPLENFDKAFDLYEKATQLSKAPHAALTNWGIALLEKARRLDGDAALAGFDAACEKYADAVRVKPDDHKALNNWGSALFFKALRLDGDAALASFDAACEKYAAAVQVNPDKHEALNNWGTALADKALRLDGDAAMAGFDAACEKFSEAVRVKPDDHEALYNWGTALLYKAQRLDGAAADDVRRQALEKFQQARDISGKGEYNLACALAVLGDVDGALDELDHCAADGTLESRAYLEADDDMAPLRGHPRFAGILEKAR